MRVMVQLRNDVAQSELGRSGSPTTLASVLNDYSLTAQPLDSGSGDPTLSSFYTIEVPPHVSADDLLQRLQALRDVQAAYVKPPDEMP